MKYPAHIYAKALAEAILAPGVKADAVAKNFFALLRRNGDEGSARKIVEEAARFVRGRAHVRKVTIESARPLKGAQKKLAESFLEKGDITEERVDPALIAGIKIIVNDESQFDGSLKGKLDTIFKTQ